MMEFTFDGIVRQGFGFYNPNHAAALICAISPFLWGLEKICVDREDFNFSLAQFPIKGGKRGCRSWGGRKALLRERSKRRLHCICLPLVTA